MSVLETVRSPRGFLVVPIHWSHDPLKTQDWAEGERAKYATETEWNREMEIDFTAQLGKPAYPNFSPKIHLVEKMEADQRRPLCLCVDFNISPMTWVIGQVVNGDPYYFAEITSEPATIEGHVQEFRNRWPAHKSEIWIYGDGTGHGRNPQTGKSDYQLLMLGMRGYPSPVVLKVPRDNPDEKDRVNAVNRRLKGADGQARLFVTEDCKETIADFTEVIYRPDGKKLLKVYDETNPYHRRTHASDCVGYHVYREWPTLLEQFRAEEYKPRPPLKYGRVLGALR